MQEHSKFSTFNAKEFGHRLKTYRLRLEKDQAEFASMIDVSPRTLLEIEAGRTEMKLSTLYLTAEVLKMPVSALLGEDAIIVNSFNTIQQEANANAHQAVKNFHQVHVDREWMQYNNKRFEFLEEEIRRREEDIRTLNQQLSKIGKGDFGSGKT